MNARLTGARAILASGLIWLFFTGPAIAQAPVCPDAGEGYARISTPQAELAFRFRPGAPKVSDFFQMDLAVCRAPDAGAVTNILVDAQMPKHGHGMNYRPTSTPTGPGAFRIAGLMLHMAGHWQITFDLVQGDRRTRLTHELDLQP